MNAYIYQAALWCEDCALKQREHLDAAFRESGAAPGSPDDDSDRYPQGPYSDGGGEADTYQHCDGCHTFLENPLTDHGVTHVLGQIKDSMAEALQHGRATTWDRVMPKPGTAEDTEAFKVWHGRRHVEIVREWAYQLLEDYSMDKDERVLVDLFLEFSEPL